MVAYADVQASNALINDATAPRVAVFVGGTSGVGKLTVRALVGTGASLRIYLVGRKSSEERTMAFIQELHAINPKAEVIWTEGEISLLAETSRLCQVIKGKETRIDLLFMTAGYAPFGPREETAEGLEITQSLEYYSRMLFVLLLLPLINRAESPRVVSVLAGGRERANMNLADMDLKQDPENFAGILGFKATMQYANMNTMTLERLADANPNVTFIHSQPGAVNSGNVHRGVWDQNSITAWFVWLFLNPVIQLIAFTDEESGQRNLFQCTSAAFGAHGVPWNGIPGVNTHGKPGRGLFLVSRKCDCSTNEKVLSGLREKAQDLIWEHTQEILRPYL